MQGRVEILGDRIVLKTLDPDRIHQDYVRWMNDSEVTQYLACRDQEHSEESIRKYVSSMNESPNNLMLGIYLKEDGTYIGNIKIGSIDPTHKNCDMGLLVGNKEEWGKGYAMEAIALLTKHAFEKLGLNKITANMLEHNQGSYRAFMKAGYREVGVFKRHVFFRGKYADLIYFEKCNH